MKTCDSLLWIAMAGALAVPANGAVVALWDFPGYTDGTQTVSASGGGQAGSASFTTSYTSALLKRGPQHSGDSDSALYFTDIYLVADNNANFVLQFSGSGWVGFQITYYTRPKEISTYSHVWEYSLNSGTSWNPAGTVNFNVTASTKDTWLPQTSLDLSGISALDNQSSVWLRNSFANADSTLSLGFDAISVNAVVVPEPSTALAGIAAVFAIAVFEWRRRGDIRGPVQSSGGQIDRFAR